MRFLCHAITLCLFIAIPLPYAGCSGGGSGDQSARTVPDSLKRYPFKSAIIELQYGGSSSGTQFIYIDDYGMREAKIDSFMTEMFGMQAPTHKIQIQDWDSTFSADLVKRSGMSGLNPLTANERKQLSLAGEEIAKGMGMEAGEETVAGKTCKVWSLESLGSRVWLWNDITLKSEVDLGDVKQQLEAKRIEIDVPVPADKFHLPGGIKIVTPEDMQKMLQKLDSLTSTER